MIEITLDNEKIGIYKNTPIHIKKEKKKKRKKEKKKKENKNKRSWIKMHLSNFNTSRIKAKTKNFLRLFINVPQHL